MEVKVISFRGRGQDDGKEIVLASFSSIQSTNTPPLQKLLNIHVRTSTPTSQQTIQHAIKALKTSHHQIPSARKTPTNLIPSHQSKTGERQVIPPVIPNVMSKFPTST